MVFRAAARERLLACNLLTSLVCQTLPFLPKLRTLLLESSCVKSSCSYLVRYYAFATITRSRVHVSFREHLCPPQINLCAGLGGQARVDQRAHARRDFSVWRHVCGQHISTVQDDLQHPTCREVGFLMRSPIFSYPSRLYIYFEGLEEQACFSSTEYHRLLCPRAAPHAARLATVTVNIPELLQNFKRQIWKPFQTYHLL